jgi:subtilase family serine protease
MNTARKFQWIPACALGTLMLCSPARAQKTNVAARINDQVDDTRTVKLQGNVHPLARPENDRGAVADSQPMQRMLLLLQRSQEQETSLRQLIDAQQTKGSASYHTWLTPEQFGKQYGPADADLQAVTDWLSRQGFSIAKVSPGRTTIEFSGNAGQVRNAFHTDIHKFVVNGEEHFANVKDPEIPAALSPAVAGVVSLHNFPKTAHVRHVGNFQRDLKSGAVRPLFTYTDLNGTFYGVGPGDFAKIYNIPAGATGAGQTIAVVGQSNINIQDIRDFRSIFGLAANDPEIRLNGPDPGLVPGDEGESDLDVEYAGAVAPMAHIIFVASQSTLSNPLQVGAGIDLSAVYIIDNNLAPVMSESYGQCEASLGTSGNQFYNSLWQQAAAQGISVVVSAGDSGSAGCDSSVVSNSATFGVSVSGLASTPYNVAMGGTDFNQFNIWSNFWNAPGTATTSAKGYIPETPWNDSQCAANFPSPCTTPDTLGADLSAASGGPSNCTTSSGIFPNVSCSGGTAIPAFQTGFPNITGSTRQIPDVSLFSGDGFNGSFYIVCESDQNPNNAPCDLSTSATSGVHNFQGVGGTSGATPTFAGIMALVNQATSSRQGNPNYVLYGLAASSANYKAGNCKASGPAAGCVFNDVNIAKNTGGVAWNNSVACTAASSADCSNQGTGFGILVSGGNPAFASAAGYDMATGLGSVNVANLLSSWTSFSRTATSTTLTNASGSTVTAGTNFSVTIGVTPSGSTGTVSLLASGVSGGLGAVGPFTLTSGTVTVTSNLLPVGTTSIVGYYPGDATHAASTSAPLLLAVSGAGYTSQTTVYYTDFVGGNPANHLSAQTISYGTPYILTIVVSKSGTSCSGSLVYPATNPTFPCPTGTVALSDGGNPLNDYPNAGTIGATNTAKLNNFGFAEDQPISLSPGTHSITATYSGDANYSAGGPSNTLSITVNKATTTTSVQSSLSSVTSGTPVTLQATISTSSNGNPPTGTVQFVNGSTNIGTPVACTAVAATSTSGVGCTASLPTTISMLPPGGPGTPSIPVLPILAAFASLLLFALGLRFMPQPRRRAYAYAGLVAFALLALGIAGCSSSNSGGGGGHSKTVTINAIYSGDTNYSTSTGSTVITVQ